MEKKNVFFWRIKSLTLNLVLVLAIKLPGCTGQGRMIEPPMRSSMWRYGFNTPNNYQDDFLHCGGYQRYLANNESCGTCGDPYDGVRHNEAGGQYATGIVGRYFSLSDTHIPVTIELTGSYGGKFEFRLCPHNSVNEPVSQMCLDRYPLLIEEGVSQGTPYSFEPKISGTYNLTVQIPDGMFCTQCVLQWKYRAENNFGINPKKTECTGCNFREHFQNCADISIGYYPEILPNVAVTKPSDHWTDQIKHLLQPDAYKFNSNETKNILLFTNITTSRASIGISTIPSPSFPIISTIPAHPFPVISTLSPLPSLIMSAISIPPSPIMSTRETSPFQVMPPIPPPPFPIMSTSSKIELKSEHIFKIPPPPQIIYPPFQVISTLSPLPSPTMSAIATPPSPIMSTKPTSPFHVMPPIPPPPLPIMSTSSKIELISEHLFKIPPPLQTISPPFQVISTLSPLPSPIMSAIATPPSSIRSTKPTPSSPVMSTIATTIPSTIMSTNMSPPSPIILTIATHPSPIMSTKPTPPSPVMSTIATTIPSPIMSTNMSPPSPIILTIATHPSPIMSTKPTPPSPVMSTIATTSPSPIMTTNMIPPSPTMINIATHSSMIVSTKPTHPSPTMFTIAAPAYSILPTIATLPFQEIHPIPPPPLPIMSTSSKRELKSEHLLKISPRPRTISPPVQTISTLLPLPSLKMSTKVTPPSPITSTIATLSFQEMPPIKPHPIPIMSTSSKIELTSEHMFKIPSLPQTISSEHPLVDGIVTNSSTETSLHHAHLDGNILPMHPHLPQNLHSDSDVSALNKQNNTLIKTGTVSTTAHDLHLNTFNIKKLELNLDKKNAENIFPSQAQASGAQSASNMMHVSSSSITDSTNVLINTSREYLDDIETRISIAELILADQLIAHEAGQNNTANIENDLNTMKTKLVSLEDKFRKMENKLIKVATDLTKVKTLTSPLKSSRKEIFRKIGLDFHFPKEKTTIVNTPAWDMKKRHVGKAPEISKNVSKDENVINSVPNIVLRKLIADLALNINSASQNESIPKTTTIANIDTWMITPQQILAPSDRVNPTKGMSLDIYTTGLLVPGSQSALNHNGIHEPQKSQTNSHPSSSAIKSAHVLNKHLPTESLLRRSPAVPVNALDLGRSSIDAGNPGRLTSLGELTVFQQPVQDNSSRRFNRIENMGIQVIQGRADIQSRDKIVLQPDMNSAPRSNRQRSLIFDSSGSDTLQSRTREMTDSSVQRTAVQANSIPDRNIGEVFVSSRETPQLSPRSQWQMIRTAQDVIDLRSSIENGETNNIRQVVPSMSRAFNSGVGNNRAVQTNALLSRGSTQQSQQQREQVNEQQLHSQQHSQQHVQRSSGSLSLSFLNRSSQVQSPLVRTFQPRTLMSQGQILPFVPAQNRFVNQQFRAPNSRSLGNINSQSQQPTVVARQSVRLFPIAGMF